ncbi:MAG: hypothetical protein JWO60_3170 [Frankiales bacterium]|nr:hypothetical protein [Frankiales bacterium]
MSEQDPRVRPPDIWDDPPSTATGRPLDLSRDPDRFVADAPLAAVAAPRRLDPSQHPDRVDRTLTEMLGEGAQEDSRDTYVWLAGLLAMLVFLALVAYVAGHLGP